jgi:hypothetical protein
MVLLLSATQIKSLYQLINRMFHATLQFRLRCAELALLFRLPRARKALNLSCPVPFAPYTL